MRTLFLACVFAVAAAASAEISPAAKSYLNKALDLMEKHSMMRKTNWKALRAKALKKAENAQTMADTYPAISEALRSLDPHSHLVRAETMKRQSQGIAKTFPFKFDGMGISKVLPRSNAAKAGLQTGMRWFTAEGKPVRNPDELWEHLGKLFQNSSEVPAELGFDAASKKPFKITLEEISDYEPPSGQLLEGGYGYIDVPQFGSPPPLDSQFATAIQEMIREMDPMVKGWIIDLRRDFGGNMYPMIAGVGPLLDRRNVGSFEGPEVHDPWWYENGLCGQGKEVACKVKNPYKVIRRKPVAVLIGAGTASAAEATAISFIGQKGVRFFGMPSAGLTSANDTYPLPDGALLAIATSVERDRFGKPYLDVLKPDVKVATDWRWYLTSKDGPVAAARRWIDGKGSLGVGR